MNGPEDHLLFGLQFMQAMEDFQSIENECPACGHGSRSNLICLRDECDFLLFIAPGKIHKSVIPWMVNKGKELQR